MRLVFLGPPGAGKGTQAARVARRYGLPHVATGDMFRGAAAAGTPLGLQAKAHMDEGRLVPDDVTIGIVRDRLSEDDCAVGFVLDGFPRTLPQAEALDRLLAELERAIGRVLQLLVPDKELLRRVTGRRVCPCCGALYHVIFQPPRRAGYCDDCGGRLVQRDDDAEATVLRRLSVYRQQTAPLIDYYGAQGKLCTVAGTGSMDEVTARIGAALG